MLVLRGANISQALMTSRKGFSGQFDSIIHNLICFPEGETIRLLIKNNENGRMNLQPVNKINRRKKKKIK